MQSAEFITVACAVMGFLAILLVFFLGAMMQILLSFRSEFREEISFLKKEFSVHRHRVNGSVRSFDEVSAENPQIDKV